VSITGNAVLRGSVLRAAVLHSRHVVDVGHRRVVYGLGSCRIAKDHFEMAVDGGKHETRGDERPQAKDGSRQLSRTPQEPRPLFCLPVHRSKMPQYVKGGNSVCVRLQGAHTVE